MFDIKMKCFGYESPKTYRDWDPADPFCGGWQVTVGGTIYQGHPSTDEGWTEYLDEILTVAKECGYKVTGRENLGYGMGSCGHRAYKDAPDIIQVHEHDRSVRLIWL